MKITQYKETTEYLFETNKEYFLRYFKDRKKDDNKIMIIAVRTPDSKSDELIINLESNIDNKIKYYEEAYDDNLRLKANPNIRITHFAYGNLGSIPLMKKVI